MFVIFFLNLAKGTIYKTDKANISIKYTKNVKMLYRFANKRFNSVDCANKFFIHVARNCDVNEFKMIKFVKENCLYLSSKTFTLSLCYSTNKHNV